jgi:hypothetical protein
MAEPGLDLHPLRAYYSVNQSVARPEVETPTLEIQAMNPNASNALSPSLKEHSDQNSTLVDRSDGDLSSISANTSRTKQNSAPGADEVSAVAPGANKLQPTGSRPNVSGDGDPWQKAFLLSLG